MPNSAAGVFFYHRESMSMPKSILTSLIVAVTAICGIGFWWLSAQRPLEELVVEAREFIAQQNPNRARQLVDEILQREPEHAEGLLLAAVIAADQSRFQDAIDSCTRVPKTATTTFASARVMAGNICLDQLEKLSVAEQYFRDALSVNEDHPVANNRLVYVLGIQTRHRELIPYHLRVLRTTPSVAIKVQLLMQGEKAYPDEELVDQLLKSEPDCAGLLLAKAQIAFLKKDPASAETWCRDAISKEEKFADAQALLGALLLEKGNLESLIQWRRSLPAATHSHPDILYVAGRISQMENSAEEAARCFWDSLRIDPNSVRVNYHLGQSLISLGRENDAQHFLERARLLERYQKQLDSTSPESVRQNLKAEDYDSFLIKVKESFDMSVDLGLPWETYSWVVIAAQAPRPPKWAQDSLREMQRDIMKLPLVRTDAEKNPTRLLDLSHLSLPDFSRSYSDVTASPAMESLPQPGRVTFQELRLGPDDALTFNNGFPQPRELQFRAYDFTGGGVGVVDVDGDTWPDLCFPQGCDLDQPANTPQNLSDSLFRNIRGSEFRNISSVALPYSADYGQGVGIGDYDSDGMADILIANLGRNRLLHNNGDGTFSDHSEALPNNSEVWTTSCVVCDLNGDSDPDLYLVNYLAGEIRTRVCADEANRYGQCAPQSFPAEQDQLLLNLGDGTFRDVSESAGILASDGKGLGVVAADFNDDGRVDLFVANDGVPNYLFENATDPQTGQIHFQEVGLARGVAVNAAGQSEACMGIAAEDMDGDGLLDLFVTNFYDETNTLYQGTTSSGYFQDVTAQTGLGQPSLHALGFGTQAIDAELDGRPDLVVVNGHVDSYPGQNVPYRMKPQYFSNKGHLNFQQETSSVPAPYFDVARLGRGLAKLDWNRDGAEDLVVTHLDEPAVLLSNTTRERGHFLHLRLVGKESGRDAVGAIVSVKTPENSVVRRITAGDGYESSNQRFLVFGLGPGSPVIESISVRWPSGKTDLIMPTTIDTELVVIEGRLNATIVER